MFWLLVIACAPVLFLTIQIAWRRYRDPLHPAMFLCVLLTYSYTIEPLLLGDRIFDWFVDRSSLDYVAILYLASIVGLCVGILHTPRYMAAADQFRNARGSIPEAKLLQVAKLLIILCVLAYLLGIYNAGGFYEAYSKSKGGGRHYSGYISESVNLGLIASMLIGIARWQKGLLSNQWLMALAAVSPNLLQGTFGGRRGPLFLALGALFLTWLVSTQRRPKLTSVVIYLGAICFVVLVVWSQRGHIHLGSDNVEFRWDQLYSLVMAEKANQGGNYIYGAGLVITAMNANKFTWGGEILVNILIRPIPKQLWPKKYEDVGATWITEAAPGFGNYGPNDWMSSVGWLPFSGSSSGSISDVFGEFSWLTIVIFYLLGRSLSWLYWRHRQIGGVWSVLLLQASALTIYLATQSFSAYYHRFLLLAVPTLVIWNYLVKRSSREFV